MSSNAIDSPESPTTSQSNTAQNSVASAAPSSSMSSASSPSAPSPSAPLSAEKRETLISQLATDSLKKQLAAVSDLANAGDAGESVLIDFIQQAKTSGNAFTAAHGAAYQQIYRATSDAAKALVAQYPSGLLQPTSTKGIDYSELQKLLIEKDYLAADKLTTQKLCELAGESAVKRKWVYFTEVKQFPEADLLAMDELWRVYSQDKFGWSKQHELWTRLGKDWARLWSQLIWQSSDGNWTRYPGEFIWDLSAPVGHLPLSNQLRGVRVMDALLSHPAWNQPS